MRSFVAVELPVGSLELPRTSLEAAAAVSPPEDGAVEHRHRDESAGADEGEYDLQGRRGTLAFARVYRRET